MTSSPTIRADLSHRKAQVRSAWVRGFAAGLLGLVLAFALVALWAWRIAFAGLPPMPDKASLWSLNRPPGVTFLDQTGAVIAIRGPRHGRAVTLAEIPAYLPHAFLAAEDRRFYSHNGVDWIGVLRAAWADVSARRVVQGGSTISQQVVRDILLSPEQTFHRKLQEAALAWRLEHLLNKDEILELYLNRTYFGGGSYGVDAAAETYFGKSARDLTLSEAALLASLPKAPSRLDPSNDLAAALARSRLVLKAMVQEGWATPAQAQQAIANPPKLVNERPVEGDFGYVIDYAAAKAQQITQGRFPDLVVKLTIDPRLQTAASQILRDGVRAGARLGATQGALVALAPDGAIRALVGGVDHRNSPYDRATQAMRQPGSAFKPFVYATALEAGIKPTDVLVDAPVRFGTWAPTNYGGGYSGPVTVAEALARSINTISAKLTHEVGPSRVAALARRFGLSTIPPHPSLSIALGTYEVPLLDLVSGYEVFQNEGRRVEPYVIQTITNARGDLLYSRPQGVGGQVYDVGRAREMIRMMEGVIQHGTGVRANFGRPAAGKTGTSQNWRDAWFIGFTPDWIAGVWVGNDRSRPMDQVAGGELPTEIWRRFMILAHQGLPARDFEGVAAAAPLPAPVQPASEENGPAPQAREAPPQPGAEAEPGAEEEPPPPRPRPRDTRSGFYSGLASDFDREAQGGGPQ